MKILLQDIEGDYIKIEFKPEKPEEFEDIETIEARFKNIFSDDTGVFFTAADNILCLPRKFANSLIKGNANQIFEDLNVSKTDRESFPADLTKKLQNSTLPSTINPDKNQNPSDHKSINNLR